MGQGVLALSDSVQTAMCALALVAFLAGVIAAVAYLVTHSSETEHQPASTGLPMPKLDMWGRLQLMWPAAWYVTNSGYLRITWVTATRCMIERMATETYETMVPGAELPMAVLTVDQAMLVIRYYATRVVITQGEHGLVVGSGIASDLESRSPGGVLDAQAVAQLKNQVFSARRVTSQD